MGTDQQSCGPAVGSNALDAWLQPTKNIVLSLPIVSDKRTRAISTLLGKLDRLDKIRFFVVDEENKPVSSVWFMQGEGQGAYIAPSTLGSSLKLSFHPPGGSSDGCDCQFGHPRRYAEGATGKGFVPMRPVRWQRRPTPTSGTIHIASIFFPTEYLMSAPQPLPNGKIKFALPRAPKGMATEAGIFLSKEHPNELEQKFMAVGGTPLAYCDFPGDEFMSLVVSHSACPPLPDIPKEDSARFRLLDGAPDVGDVIQGRAILCSDVPRDGSAFLLAEVGPLTVSRSA